MMMMRYTILFIKLKIVISHAALHDHSLRRKRIEYIRAKQKLHYENLGSDLEESVAIT